MAIGASKPESAVFPFSAVVGQDRLKLALLIAAIDPRIGGVLVRGEKGTAKSTAVRALAAVMPPVRVVDGCRFSCDPLEPSTWCSECRERAEQGPLPATLRETRLVELPVSATEDRLVGTIDIGRALRDGERSFEPGILAKANRALLYVDEVNLLEDHLVDTLLDAAAMGVNTVEREGVSFLHPSRFVLVGTMNPEEGDVRPQLLDRFGLCVDVEGERDPALRVEIMRRRREFDTDPAAFASRWADAEDELRERLRAASALLRSVNVPDELLYTIANLALTVGVDGHRADQTMARAAAAHAALDGRDIATVADIGATAGLALAHRTKRTLFDEPQLSSIELSALIDSVLGAQEVTALDAGERPDSGSAETCAEPSLLVATLQVAPSAALSPGQLSLDASGARSRGAAPGRVRHATAEHPSGRYTRAQPGAPVSAGDVAIDATIAAAAAHSTPGDVGIEVRREDLQRKVRTRPANATIVFCVDTSGSMGATERLDVARSAILDLLGEAYRRRDRVALVTFRGEAALVVLAPTASVALARVRLSSVPTGGATPLAAGLVTSLEVVERERVREPDNVSWLVLLTDARANVGVAGGRGSEDALAAARKVRAAGVHVLLVDPSGFSAASPHSLELAAAAGARRISAGDGGHTLASAVRSQVTDA